jgi:hypothetical protein
MEAVTRHDREQELKALLAQLEAHPERDWTAERERVAVLREMLHRHAA